MKAAPTFTLKKWNENQTWSLDLVENKAVMLTFFTTWCPDCQRDLQAKQMLYAKMQKERIEMVMIHVTGRDPQANLHSFLEQNHYTFPVLLDEGTSVYDQYHAYSVPTTVLMNDQHEIVRTYGDKASMMDIMQGLAVIFS